LSTGPRQADGIVAAHRSGRTADVGATRARALLVIVGDPDVVAADGLSAVADKLRGAG
jgi:hypothetical protein